jgi:hypothetical protein
LKFVPRSNFPNYISLIQILGGGGGGGGGDDDDDRMLMKIISLKGCPQIPTPTSPTSLVTRVCHTLALQFTLKSILRQKKNYGNSNIFHHAKIYIIFKKSSKRN